MNKSLRNIKFILQSLFPFALITGMFLIVPAIVMVFESFKNASGQILVLDNYKTIFTNAYYMKAITNSVKISVFSSLVGLIIALVFANSLVKVAKPHQNRIITILNMTSNFSGVPLSFGYILLLGNTGLFILLLKHLGIESVEQFNLYSWIGLTLTYVYFQIPIAVMLLYPAFLGIRKEWNESAMLLGAGPLQFWAKIGIPVLFPSIIGTFSILFANSMGAYSTAYALVGNNYNLMTIRIGSLVVGDIMPQHELASALAVILGVTTIGTMVINERMSKKMKRGLE